MYHPHHFGIVVSDLDVSTEFYEQFGGVVASTRHFEGPDISRTVGVANADVTIRHLRFDDLILELLEYHGDRRPLQTNIDDIGAAHVALTVDDIHAAYDAMSAKGIRVVSEPLAHT